MAPTSSPAGWGGLGLFLAEKDGQRRAASVSCCPRVRCQTREATGDDRSHPRGRPPMSWWSAATIAQPGTAQRLVAASDPPQGFPVRGVLHAAAVVEDATLANITERAHRA